MHFWHVEKSLADTKEMARQQDFVCKQNCYCLCCPLQLLSIKSGRWNDDDDDDPRDQGHDNNDSDVIRDGDDVRSVLREYIANA